MPYRWHFIDHHLAHEASAFLPAPFTEAAVLTMDGRGERVTTSYAIGRDNQLQRLGEVELPHSLGLLYEAITRHLGFLHSSDEYKVMALASFGTPRYAAEFARILTIGDNGQYRVDLPPLMEVFGRARAPGEPLTPHHYDVASSLQKSLEETVLTLAHWPQREIGLKNLCMAGGVALNCVMKRELTVAKRAMFSFPLPEGEGELVR